MKKYYINGTEKTKADCTPSCSVCKDGAVFNDAPYKTHSTLPAVKEHICQVCETKYKEPRLTPVLPVEMLLFKEVYASQIQAISIDNKDLNTQTAPYIALRISEDYEQETKKINEKVQELRNTFERTKTCLKHMWIESKPFKTCEGSFTIKNCAICKTASIFHDGKERSGKLSELINFLISQSELFSTKARIKGDLFADIILKGVEIKAPEITATIDTARELPEKRPELIF